ncbi:MAG: Uma2 family endonuclease [Capsulimonadales bacterium]|nr:Uma2 family endonuclease [Capsulimonadales bacterium]
MSTALPESPTRPPADTSPHPRLTIAEYFALDSMALRRGEYIEGQRIEMAGASRRHVTISKNIVYGLESQVEDRDCDVFATDTRVRANGHYYYPDVGVVCGEYLVDALNPDTLTNPTVLIEVLSDSTEVVDRGSKFRDYRRLPSLRTYLMVTQDYPRVEQYERDTGGWRFVETEGLSGVVELSAIDCRLEMARIYRRVPFSAPEIPTDSAMS